MAAESIAADVRHASGRLDGGAGAVTPLVPSQAAREAAADFVENDGEFFINPNSRAEFCSMARAGRLDREDIILAFARFEQSIREDQRERDAKVAESFATCGCNNDVGICLVDDPPKGIAAAIREGDPA